MTPLTNRAVLVALSVSFVTTPLLTFPVAAQDTVRALRDLEQAHANDAHRHLSERGYVRQSPGGEYENWWNNQLRQCISVRHEGGRVASIVTAPSVDCGHTGSSDPGDAKVAAAVGAAAILAVAVLAHKSHHHDDDTHKDSAQEEANYERGYRDALHGYDAQPNSDGAYSDGYGAGLRERSSNVPWRKNPGNARNGSHQDLVNVRASSADSALRQRGFVDRDAQILDGRSVVTWWNKNSQECLHVATEDGRIASIRNVDAESCR